MKRLILLLIPLLFVGCSDSKSDMPGMKIVSIWLGGDENEINYAGQFNKMPVLTAGDEVDIQFRLLGNGNDLRTFIVRNESGGMDIELFFKEDEISEEFSELNNGVLAFGDGVSETEVTVKAKANGQALGEQVLSFYLSSKAANSTGANIDLAFNTGVSEE